MKYHNENVNRKLKEIQSLLNRKLKEIYPILNEIFNKGNQTVNKLRKFLKKLRKTITKAIRNLEKNKRLLEQIQLTCIYICGTFVLMNLLKSSLGFFPAFLYKVFPFADIVFTSPYLRLFSSSEKTFAISLLILELAINRPIIKFSLLVKFNLLLVILMEMIQSTILGYWDLLMIRDLTIITELSRSGKPERFATLVFFYIFFGLFFTLYLYFYSRAIRGKFPSFPQNPILEKIIESIAFWFHIKKEPNPEKNSTESN